VEPAGAGEELVGEGMGLQEADQLLELRGVLGADVGSLALQMLRAGDATHESVDTGIAETGVDDDGTANGLAGRFQQHQAAIDHVGNLLRRRNVGRVPAGVAELRQRKV